MADANDIPTGTYTLTLGKSFDSPAKGKKSDNKADQFHTLRYDFKPSSVSNEADTYIAFGNSGDVHVTVPNEGDNMTVYKGSKKDAKPKECLLFFDKRTNTVRLEKITSNINVKNTRDLDPGTEDALKRGIERLRTSSSTHPAQVSTTEEKPKSQPVPDSSDSSSDSDGSSDSDKSNVDSSDDEDESALLQQLNQSKPAVPPATTSSSYTHQSHHHQSQPHNRESHTSSYSMPTGFASSSSNSNKNKGDSEKYGLALSESSDEDD